jgi:xylulokinase
LGAGLRSGVVTLSLGTAGAFSKLWVNPATDGDMRIGWSAYVHDSFWVTEGVINTAGSSLRWLRDIMYPGCGYDRINAEASAALSRGSDLLFYPYLSGASSPDRYPNSTGCFYGASLATQRGDFALSVMEAVAFQTKIILEAMGGTDGIHALVMFGGGAKSPLWCQIMADVLGFEIRVPVTAEAAGAGAAILAGIASGNFTRASCPALPYGESFVPSSRQADYERKYSRYRSIEYKLWRGDASANTQPSHLCKSE